MGRELRMPTEEEFRAHGAPPFAHVRAIPIGPMDINEADHTIGMMVSTDQWARDGMRILPAAWSRNLDTYRQNPQVTFGHRWWDLGIGLAREVVVRDNGLWAQIWFDVEGDAEIARIWQAIVSTRLRCASVSWDGDVAYSYPRKAGDANEFGEWVQREDGSLGWEYRDNLTLFEIAMVPIPSDTGANATLGRSLGLRGLEPEPTKGEAEGKRVTAALERMRGAIEDVRNWCRMVERDGGAPSPDIIAKCLSPIRDLAEIATGRTREGKVLSASNKQLVQDAIDALSALLSAAAGSADDGGREAEVPNGQSLEALVARLQDERAANVLREIGV